MYRLIHDNNDFSTTGWSRRWRTSATRGRRGCGRAAGWSRSTSSRWREAATSRYVLKWLLLKCWVANGYVRIMNQITFWLFLWCQPWLDSSKCHSWFPNMNLLQHHKSLSGHCSGANSPKFESSDMAIYLEMSQFLKIRNCKLQFIKPFSEIRNCELEAITFFSTIYYFFYAFCDSVGFNSGSSWW